MKAHILILLSCLELTAAVTDLGVISPRHGILLNTETTRPDFKSFEAEFKPSSSTNVVTLTITNTLITVDDLSVVPSGRTIMGLKSNFLDGSVSDMSIYTFDLRRASAPAPSAVRAPLRAGSDESKSLISELNAIQNAQAIPPPMPSRGHTLTDPPWAPILPSTNGLDMETGLPMAEITIRQVYTNITGELIVTNRLSKPLPNAKNQTYAEYLDWLADRKGKRRNE
jgi:hypothetical protein